MYRILLICSLLTATFACKKKTDKVYTIINPGPYLPAYPESYWKYVNSFQDTVELKTSGNYQYNSYTDNNGDKVENYVPIYNGLPLWVYQENAGVTTQAGSSTVHYLLRDDVPVGTSWQIPGYGGVDENRKVFARDTTVVVNGISYSPTIVIEQYNQYSWINRKYYCKNVGMVKMEAYDISTQDTTIFELVEYHISK